jgi:NAD(P)-dependent dehydrogenase (short-subunit alcohol dehydrogenase family)
MPADGLITFLTGGAAVRPRLGASMVSATFAALGTLARGLAIELGPLRVNTIRPGYTDSEMWGFLDPAALEQLWSASSSIPVTLRLPQQARRLFRRRESRVWDLRISFPGTDVDWMTSLTQG